MKSPEEIILNGSEHPLAGSTTVEALLAKLGLQGVPVLVEHNAVALFPREFPVTLLRTGDTVEIIRVVAGG